MGKIRKIRYKDELSRVWICVWACVWACVWECVRECVRVAFPTHSRSVWYPTHSQIFLREVHLNFPNSLKEIARNGCGTMRAAAVTWQSPISPLMFLQTGLGRASTRHLSQPPVGGDWGLPRYSRRPHRPTHISQDFSERFSKIQVYHTQKFSWECGISHTPWVCGKRNAPYIFHSRILNSILGTYIFHSRHLDSPRHSTVHIPLSTP